MIDAATAGTVLEFIARWQGVKASELSTSQTFLIELCELLGVERPHPTPAQDYMFERPITFAHGDGSTSAGRVDLYRRGAFVLESKKLKAATHTKGFDDGLLRARTQAEAYARALPAGEGRPPFVVVVDVGNRIELYSEFSCSGGTYVPFPDPAHHRIALEQLSDPAIRQRLRKVWLEPLSLDPSRESARVTREIADRLAQLARSLETSGHPAEEVSRFLMRCLFTMFAEDVRLLPEHSFRDLLKRHREQPDVAMRMVQVLWRDMDVGGFSPVLATDVLRFNGKLFKDAPVLPLDAAQVELLILAAQADWQHVEPAIFGTLLERALDPAERHKLGAHYTPRAYVERLVLPTVIEPLRAQWSDAQAAAGTLASEGKREEAVDTVLAFHRRLCAVRVLDPACGSGNFLYVTLEHLKRLEGEVLNVLDELDYRQTGLALGDDRADAMGGETVDPHNLLGIELNPRAATIAEVVLWIGYLQWHFRTRGSVPPAEPVVRDFRNIENRDAVLAHDGVELVRDEHGVPVTRWDGSSYKTSPVTGEQVPDESARKPLERYLNPRKPAWPQADFIVGNPPFIGASTMRAALGDGYVDALRTTWNEIPESADFVMYWWHQAALLTRQGATRKFGFITTNSIRQTFNRRVVEAHLGDAKQPLSLAFAIPDHPWVDTTEGAAVRIAMTVGMAGSSPGRLLHVESEATLADEVQVRLREKLGLIHEDMRVGANVASASYLLANGEISNRGFCLFGAGFIVSPDEVASLGLGKIEGIEQHLRPYRNGRDLTQFSRDAYVIDLFGLTPEEARARFPEIYQRVLEKVKPERDTNNREIRRRNWWIFGEPNPKIRSQLKGLPRYIATVETTKHRVFQFLDAVIAPDNMLVCIAIDDASALGVLSSKLHEVWALAAGGRLGVGNDPRYNKTRCFETFAFPAAEADQSAHIADLAEQLDAHRKRQQAAHPGLTLTGMYNVLDALRSGTVLSAKEKLIHEQGLVSVLRQLHDELDAAVLAAYGWSDLLADLRIAHGNDPAAEGDSAAEAKRRFEEAVLERLVALNAERSAEEARGHIRWLRPEFQNPQAAPSQTTLIEQGNAADAEEAAPAAVPAAAKPVAWPKDPLEQVRAVAEVLGASALPLDIDQVAARFSGRGPWKRRLPALLDMLVALGRARYVPQGYLAC